LAVVNAWDTVQIEEQALSSGREIRAVTAAVRAVGGLRQGNARPIAVESEQPPPL